MGKTTVSIPLVTLRQTPEGSYRPRYIPGERHRKLGLKGEDLRHPDGTWFTLDECDAWSKARVALVAELDEKTPRQRRKTIAQLRGHLTVAELFRRWFEEPRLNGIAVVEGKKKREPLAEKTVTYYKNGADRLEELNDGQVWNAPAAAITASMLGNPDQGILHRIEVKHGLATARCVRAAISGAYGWGIGKGLLNVNPAGGKTTRLPTPAPRIRYGSIEEMRALVAAADLTMRPAEKNGDRSDGLMMSCADVGDAIVLGLWTGQRQGDRFRLDDGRVLPDGIVFRQGKKHGQPLLIPPAPELAARLNSARIRRADWKVNYPHVLLDEVQRAPWDEHWYRKVFRRVRNTAVFGMLADGTVPDRKFTPAEIERHQWLLKPTPSLADFHDQDLRDTAVTWLALAGNDIPAIIAVTGHSPKSAQEILKHYLGLHPALAKSAIGKMVAWFEAQQGEGT